MVSQVSLPYPKLLEVTCSYRLPDNVLYVAAVRCQQPIFAQRPEGLDIFRYASTYLTGIRLLAAQTGNGVGGSLPSLDYVVTYRFKGLDKAQGAFELATRISGDDGNLMIKVVIEA